MSNLYNSYKSETNSTENNNECCSSTMDCKVDRTGGLFNALDSIKPSTMVWLIYLFFSIKILNYFFYNFAVKIFYSKPAIATLLSHF